MPKQFQLLTLVLLIVVSTFTSGMGQVNAGDAGPVAIDAGVAVINAQNSMIQFTGTHKASDPSPRVGNFRAFNGTLAVSDGRLQSVNVEIDVSSLKTSIVKLTNHLKSPDFFDVREYPTATFESTGIEAQSAGGEDVTIIGNLTLMEETKSVQIPAKVNISPKGIMMEAQFTIDRTEFGMTGMTDGVDEAVGLLVTVGKSADTHEEIRGKLGDPSGFRDPIEMFKNRDKNGDGKLEGDEIPKMMRERVSNFDSNGDGAITKDEMETRMNDMRRGRKSSRNPRNRPARDADN